MKMYEKNQQNKNVKGIQTRPLFWILCAGALFPFFIACGNSGSEIKTTKNWVVVAIESDPTDLDPRKATDVASNYITRLVFAGLLQFDEKGNLVPDMAATYEIASPREYRFTLRKDLCFHDGKPLTSADVKYTFDSILDPETASPKRSGYEQLEAIETPDANTVIFRLREPYAPFLSEMTQGIVPSPEQPGKYSHSTNPVGSGPFRFLSWARDEVLKLAAFDRYYGGRPGIDGVKIRVIQENTVRILEAEHGGVDIIQNNIPPDTLEHLRGHDKLNIVQAPGSHFSYITFNMTDEILGKQEVRRAIAHAVDRGRIIKYLLGNLAEPADSLLRSDHWAYLSTGQIKHDPAKAKALLDKAGYPDPDGDGPATRFTLEFKGTTNKQAMREAEIVQEDLRQVGIEMKIRTFEWGTFYADLKSGNFQLTKSKWVGISEPDIYYFIFHSANIPPNGPNRGRYVNSDLDKLLEAGRVAADPVERKEIYHRVQEILARDLPYVNLWHQDNVALVNKRIRGYVLYRSEDLISLRSVSIIK